MAWKVSKKGKEVLKRAREISKVTNKIVENDSYLGILSRCARPFIERERFGDRGKT